MTTVDLNERKEPPTIDTVTADNWREFIGQTLPHRDMLRLRWLARQAGEYVEVVSLANGQWYIKKEANE